VLSYLGAAATAAMMADLDCTPMVQGDGPQLITALICERVLEEKDGILSAIRIFDGLLLPQPQEDRPALAPLSLLITLRRGSAPERQQIRIRLVGPSGKQTLTDSHDIVFGAEEDQGLNLRLSFVLELQEEGSYWFEVIVADRLAARLPLKVAFVPPATLGSREGADATAESPAQS
jgi:hypothetical protein